MIIPRISPRWEITSISRRALPPVPGQVLISDAAYGGGSGHRGFGAAPVGVEGQKQINRRPRTASQQATIITA
jgi:hypothetical protein